MATEERSQIVLDIVRASMQVSAQGKYHVFANYSGHVELLNVYAYNAEGDYTQEKCPIKDWGFSDEGRYLHLDSCSDESLQGLLRDVMSLLETDSDGIPL